MAGRGCNLECVKGDDAGKDVIEFMGPVKIILVDQPTNLYMRKRFAAAAIVLAHMMMGATSMTVFYYTLSYQKDTALFASHIVLGTAGLQLCMPSGILAVHKLAGSTAVLRLPHRPFEHFLFQFFAIICGILSALASYFFGNFKITVHSVTGIAVTLMAILNAIFGIIVYDYSGTRIDHTELAEAILSLNYANGWSTPMRLRHRRLAHTLLQMCAMALAITGTLLITIDKGLSSSPHGLTGLIAGVLACIAFLTGACGLFGGRNLKLFHITFGIPTFMMSSISFCFGLFTKEFKEWAGSTVVFILLGFIMFYTFFIMITCFIKYAMRI
ncbi:unnamed protein product [Pieris macdunnoughi]|uniref:ascorbate ferrireductase (transmembrane) n=1 Tax=Pieris macdunnoughi TaxID=345717 RepID=A0A821SF32_9NEOP|nr:unnamed protein product [Pieris macdunnoughi]